MIPARGSNPREVDSGAGILGPTLSRTQLLVLNGAKLTCQPSASRRIPLRSAPLPPVRPPLPERPSRKATSRVEVVVVALVPAKGAETAGSAASR